MNKVSEGKTKSEKIIKEKTKKKGASRKSRFLRWLGVMPLEDFKDYAESIYKVLVSLENFSKACSGFNDVVATKLSIKYDAKTNRVVEVKPLGKSEEEVEREYSERGMI